MNKLFLKLAIGIIVVFGLLLASFYLWVPAKIWYYTGQLKNGTDAEKVTAVDSLVSLDEEGREAIKGYLNGGDKAAKLLFEAWPDVNAGYSNDEFFCSFLIWAIDKKYKDVMRLLVAKGADVNGLCCEGRDAPLIAAITKGRVGIARFLIKKGANVNLKLEGGATPLHVASEKGNIKIVKVLVEKGADINHRAHRSWTPLHLAASNGHESVVELLLDKGADIKIGAEYNWTPLHLAAENGHENIAGLLISRGADVNTMCWVYGTPLHCAVSNGHKDIVKLLLENGAKINAKLSPANPDTGDTPLDYAESEDMKKLLRSHGAKTFAELKAGQKCKVRYYVNKLHSDKPADRVAAVDGLLGLGNNGREALREYLGSAEAAKLLIAHWPKYIETQYGYLDPITDAVVNGYCKVVELFIDKKGGANDKPCGTTVLFLAIIRNKKEMAELLISRGADVNEPSSGGHSPLYAAAKRGQKEIVKLLISSGANVNMNWRMRDSNSMRYHRPTPLDSANESGHKDIARLLRSHGAKTAAELKAKEK